MDDRQPAALRPVDRLAVANLPSAQTTIAASVTTPPAIHRKIAPALMMVVSMDPSVGERRHHAAANLPDPYLRKKIGRALASFVGFGMSA